MIPPLARIDFNGTHRLIPSKESVEGSVLGAISDDPRMLAELAELDGATNGRLLAEQGLAPGIGVHELVFGLRYSSVVNAAFTHPSPWGSRFNSAARGAWYAALKRETSIREVAFHKARQLADAGWTEEEICSYDDYLAGFHAEFHDLRPGRGSAGQDFSRYLKPGPVPRCYAAPQRLAEKLLAARSNGVVYPSVRHRGGVCLACFRPALVSDPRRAATIEMRLRVERGSIEMLRTRTLGSA